MSAFLEENNQVNLPLLYAYFDAQDKSSKGKIRVYKTRHTKRQLRLKQEELKKQRKPKILIKIKEYEQEKARILSLSMWKLIKEFREYVGYKTIKIFRDHLESTTTTIKELDHPHFKHKKIIVTLFYSEQEYIKKGKVKKRKLLVRKEILHEGIAFPPPIDENDTFLGILPHELDYFCKLWFHHVLGWKKAIMNLWCRGIGKTFIATWFVQFTMEKLGLRWLYLSETEIIGDVGLWIFKWAFSRELIKSSEKNKGKIVGGKKDTYKSFELYNGAELRIFQYMSEAMVGQHAWHLMLDDILKKKWQNKPTDLKRAEHQWLWNLRPIRKMGVSISGTRKFEGDLLEFFMRVIKDIYVDVRTPYVMEGTYPEWTPVIDPQTGHEIMAIPELYEWEQIEEMKYTPREDDEDPFIAFMSEMMQNPSAIEGGAWQKDDLMYRSHYDYLEYEACAIAVDPAFTVSNTSAQTGFTVTLLHSELGSHKERRFLVLRGIGKKVEMQDWFETDLRTGKEIKHEGMLTIIENLYQFVRMTMPGMRMIRVPIETNNGGGKIIEQARYEHDKYEFAAHIDEINTKVKDKRDRIKAGLYSPIKNGDMEFLDVLEDSDLEHQILHFPYGQLIDIIDSLEIGVSVLTKLKRVSSAKQRIRDVEEHVKQLQESREREKWNRENTLTGYREAQRKKGAIFRR